MAVWTEGLNTNFNFPYINIYNLYKDGVLDGYEARTQLGYVMYDPNTTYTDMVWNEEMGMYEEIEVHYYFTLVGFPKTYDLNNFPYLAIPREEADENYIYGVTPPKNPKPEVM